MIGFLYINIDVILSSPHCPVTREQYKSLRRELNCYLYPSLQVKCNPTSFIRANFREEGKPGHLAYAYNPKRLEG